MRFTQFMCLRLNQASLLHIKQQQFVPKHQPVLERDVKRLESFLLSKPNIVVLTGAGISTESGEFANI